MMQTIALNPVKDCKNAGNYKEYQDKCRCRPKFSEVKILNPYDVNEPFTIEKQGILDIQGQKMLILMSG